MTQVYTNSSAWPGTTQATGTGSETNPINYGVYYFIKT